MTVPIIHVDTFVDKGLRGNAAAVCVLPGPAESSWMQSIAHKMNVSETAFFYRKSDGFNLRWFSPLGEVELPTARLQGEWIKLDFPSLPQHETASPLELR
jgi:PhzF family phenazine biosynthesis protein